MNRSIYRRSRAALFAVFFVTFGCQATASDILVGKFASLRAKLGNSEVADNAQEIYIVPKGDKYLVTEFAKGEFQYDYLAKPCDPRKTEMRRLLPSGEVYAICSLQTGSVKFLYSQNGVDARDLPIANVKDADGKGSFEESYFQQQYYLPPFFAFRKVDAFKYAPNDPVKLLNHETPEYKALCESAGVKLLEKSAAPVRSIAYDFDPKRISAISGWSGVSRVEVDEDGRALGFGGFSNRGSAEATKAVSFEFTERRAGDGAGSATINPTAPYYRFPSRGSNQPYYGVDNLIADVVAFLDVDKPDEYRKAPIKQEAIRYQITLTDRRSSAVLGVQVFVVDRLNNRACGVNVDRVISPSAFVFDAINR